MKFKEHTLANTEKTEPREWLSRNQAKLIFSKPKNNNKNGSSHLKKPSTEENTSDVDLNNSLNKDWTCTMCNTNVKSENDLDIQI